MREEKKNKSENEKDFQLNTGALKQMAAQRR
jgi:hypothetical protein